MMQTIKMPVYPKKLWTSGFVSSDTTISVPPS